MRVPEETIGRTGAVNTKTGAVRQSNTDRRTGKESRRLWNVLLPCVLCAVAAFLTGCVWTYYYDLNDDSLMAEILAGSYTGVPAFRNIQSYFPLTAVLGGLYRMAAGIDWYGLFLLVCQSGSLAIVLGRILNREESKQAEVLRKTGAVLLALLAAAGVFLYHFVFLQYSVTVGMIGSAAAFWFLTMEPGESRKDWAGEILPPVLLIGLGFLLRSEMMIFVGPFAALSFLIRALELPLGRKKKFRLMGIVLLLVLAVLGLGELGNRLGYRSAQWQEFNRFFDARTQLYDFQKIPAYEDNESIYESIGLNAEEAELIWNYNFGLDGNIDADKLEALASYAKGKAGSEKSTGTCLREALWDYRASMTTNAEEPYRMISLVLYGTALILSVGVFLRKSLEEDEKENNSGRSARFFFLRQAGWILMLFALRSALFLYLYYNHRPVVRLTHSIYLAEAVILLWMIAKALEGRKKGGIAVFLLLSLVFLAAAGIQVREITEEQNSRLAKNAPYEEFLDYCREHPENVYLTDVYSTVDFSDPLFAAGGKPVNYDLMGGWASKSPLEREKLENLGVLPPETENCSENAGSFAGETAPALDEILLAHENVYVAAETGADLSWLTEYYAAKGQQASVKEEDRIGNDWVIYSVE